MWEEERREHLEVKFFRERIWLEERMEDIQRSNTTKCFVELKEVLRERQVKEMREKQRALEAMLEEVKVMLKELQKQKEEYQTPQDELRKLIHCSSSSCLLKHRIYWPNHHTQLCRQLRVSLECCGQHRQATMLRCHPSILVPPVGLILHFLHEEPRPSKFTEV
ncbi:hypothetical protein SRHO_G00022570 [Serrasalmus rhombeus]